ncbi:MAG: hypothetical protein UY16_C0011G0015 [Candidatus Gottesmanbacteria bacterium GW2011_GWA2_47_9]|uniref:Fido domain-containing protein n=3 Tax=Candidatus Gottesmaniibacteriota TaxID=1752720 RepID=A0A0G1UPR9_9BACT|nr:MAG: hypothetical protein UY16_C0011G0015 [Candidatus Gottesmanbacteria bacterium GW2011_GWA2_47_9]KKU96081.1 MAG: hypothetical protein UY27_C0004G0011 [Candidatus Gottesmanbacteria bacterium GW2011_GWA1_48_13]
MARFVVYYLCMYSPRFTITSQINSAIAEIERLRVAIEHSRILPTKEVVLRRRAAIEATRSSTGIEGNPLSEQEVELVLSGQTISASERFITEVVNYKKALSHIEKRSKDATSLTAKDILTLHRMLMKDLLPKTKSGAFRKTPIYIVDIIGGKDIVRYQGPEPDTMMGLVDDFLGWLREETHDLHPLLVAGILHYEFVSIHPFSDGNGRITRLLTLVYLYQHGYAFRKVFVPESYYFADTKRYYQALGQASDYAHQHAADMTPWLSYFIEGLRAVVNDVSEKITRASWSGSQRGVLTLSEEDYRIIDFIAAVGTTMVNEIVSAVKVPKRTLQRRLSRLVRAGILMRTGRGPSTQYKLKNNRS